MVDFDNNGAIETVLAYASDTEPVITTGVRVLKYHAPSGWAVAFEETDGVINGAGVSAAINIDKLRASSGKEGVVVVLHNSGAGTATTWHVLASVGNKISRLAPDQSRAKVLKHRGYQDWGYNGVNSKGDFVIESQPGYSRNTARCCPDGPSIDMMFRFTGQFYRIGVGEGTPFQSDEIVLTRILPLPLDREQSDTRVPLSGLGRKLLARGAPGTLPLP
jgi:hypothetical protein